MPTITPTRGSPRWDDCDAEVENSVDIEPGPRARKTARVRPVHGAILGLRGVNFLSAYGYIF